MRLLIPVSDGGFQNQTIYGACGLAVKTGAMIKQLPKTNTENVVEFLPILKRRIKPSAKKPIYLVFDK